MKTSRVEHPVLFTPDSKITVRLLAAGLTDSWLLARKIFHELQQKDQTQRPQTYLPCQTAPCVKLCQIILFRAFLSLLENREW